MINAVRSNLSSLHVRLACRLGIETDWLKWPLFIEVFIFWLQWSDLSNEIVELAEPNYLFKYTIR